MLAQRTTAPVSMRALMGRINRKLAADGQVLRAARSPKVVAKIGEYFVVRGNRIARERVDPEALGWPLWKANPFVGGSPRRRQEEQRRGSPIAHVLESLQGAEVPCSRVCQNASIVAHPIF
jgi:hypothetical protein